MILATRWALSLIPVCFTASLASAQTATRVKAAPRAPATTTAPISAGRTSAPAPRLKPVRDDGYIQNGWRVGLTRAFSSVKQEGKVRAGFATFETKANPDAEQEFGLSLGYGSVPVNAMGFIAQGTFQRYAEDFQTMRAEGSATLGLNDRFYVFGGPHLQILETKTPPGLQDFRIQTGFGFQLGAGFQFTRNWGLSLAYAATEHIATGNGTVELGGGGGFSTGSVETELDVAGLEVTLVGTF